MHARASWSRHTRLAVLSVAAALVVAAKPLLGPPRITVTEVTSNPPTPGAVFAIVTEHHTQEEWAEVTAQAITMRAGQRVEKTLEVSRSGSRGRYGVRTQWDAGAPWVLIFSVKQGEDGKHGTASALAKIDHTGKVVGIEMLTSRNARGTTYPRDVTEKDITRAMAELKM